MQTKKKTKYVWLSDEDLMIIENSKQRNTLCASLSDRTKIVSLSLRTLDAVINNDMTFINSLKSM